MVVAAAAFGVRQTDGEVQLHAVLGDPPSPVELRRRLLEKLPDYLVPVRWWAVEEFPITPHGKLDRGAPSGPDARSLAISDHQPEASS